ncbi:VPLPA-CTERM sorting domain-containing protein [uncultured Celeribacter sp.]|uniref:VPLPA-CTERM sorting domain-containing protein n=1 Tax=uncultured Celeribacter sp. TaxID=1303376 RepID=UPI002AA91364|nr:VPLPA-CTERM sorting domain-containing protein [uncultured Celeribacter sp.]
MRNSGVITGTSGIAMDLGLDDDTVEMADFSAVTGDILFGERMDRLVIDGLTGAFSGSVDFGTGDDVFEVAGLSLMDGDWMFDAITEIYGGAGIDTLSFSTDFATFLNEVTVSVLDAVTYALRFGDAPAQLVFTDFETLRFSDGTYAMSDLAPVPLPAGLWLMLSGLGGFAVMRRRKSVA